MAKLTGILSEISGKLGNELVGRQTVHGAILARAPRKTGKIRRSEKQANTRCQMANMSSNFRLYEGKLVQAFESKRAGLSESNAFVQVNYGKNPVFITRQERISGACVVSNYQFSQGTLPSIGMSVNSDGKLVSDISLGTLVIDENTTVADLSISLIKSGQGWENGDQLTFFYATQWKDSEDIPRATMTSQKVVLDIDNENKLWSIVGDQGFQSNNGLLSMKDALNNAGAAWVHSREKNDGNIKVSSQRLYVVSDILANYQTHAAMVASASSYGGINTKSAYLNPSSESYVSLINGFGDDSGEGGGSNTGQQDGGGTDDDDPNALGG